MTSIKGLARAAVLAGAVVAGGAMIASDAEAASKGMSGPGSCYTGGASAFADFASCTVTMKGPAGQDSADNVAAALAVALTDFSSITLTGGYFAGKAPDWLAKTGSEWAGGKTNSFTFNGGSLVIPTDTLFITLKQGNAFEIFNVASYAASGAAFTLTHTLGRDTSHMSLWTGDVAVNPVPLPAAGLLFAPALAGLYLYGRRRGGARAGVEVAQAA